MAGVTTGYYEGSSTTGAWDSWIITTCDTSTGHVWVNWSGDIGTACSSTSVDYGQAPPPLSAEEQERRRLADEQWQSERQEAKERAQALLHQVLDDEQRVALDANGRFHVVSQQGKRYSIGRTHGVHEENDEGQGIASYCIHPSESVPHEDTMLAQKLLLEMDEALFLETANRSAIRR